MNLRRKKPNDSLYMLLDTMCNAFGGIILLAVMVVLLTNKEKNLRGSSSDSQEMLQRRLVLAQTNLDESLRLESALQAKANDGRWKQQMTLLSTRKDLQDAIQDTHELIAENTKDLETATAVDPADRLRFLNSELANEQAKKLEVQNSLGAAEQNIHRLKQRLAGMQQQVTAKFNDLQRPLRLPIEHETDKSVIYIIVQYGRIYPCRNSDLSQNDSDINWTSTFITETAEPIQDKGLSPYSAASYFNSLSGSSVYVVFCVFEDSFPAFIQARQAAIDNGISYGWEPRLNAGGPVIFSETGHIPRPQ